MFIFCVCIDELVCVPMCTNVFVYVRVYICVIVCLSVCLSVCSSPPGAPAAAAGRSWGEGEGREGVGIVVFALFHSLTALLSLKIYENHKLVMKAQSFGFTRMYNFLTYAYF